MGTAQPLPVQPPPTIPPAARTTTQRNVFSSCDSINTAVGERCRSDPRGEELEGHGCLERRPAGFMWCAMLIYHFLPSAYHRLLGGWVVGICQLLPFPSPPSSYLLLVGQDLSENKPGSFERWKIRKPRLNHNIHFKTSLFWLQSSIVSKMNGSTISRIKSLLTSGTSW